VLSLNRCGVGFPVYRQLAGARNFNNPGAEINWDLLFGLVHRAGWCCVGELCDGIGDEAPDRRAVAIALGGELVGACDALTMGVVAIAFEHQGRGTSDVDVGNHGTIATNARCAKITKACDARERRCARFAGMPPILTAEDVVKRIAAECAFIDDRGAVGIRLEPAAGIVRQYGEQFRRVRRKRGRPGAKAPPLL
jgi:hypothetical protein